MDFINFENKKILVTGASSGIGRATAILLSQLNARVILNGRNEKELNKTLNYMERKNEHMLLPFDVNDYDNYEKYFDKCIEDGDKVSGLVYSSGIYRITSLRVMFEKDIDDIFNTNIKSFIILSSMLSKKKYSDKLNIVAISSIVTHYPSEVGIVYSATKGAIESAVLSMALELARKKSRVNVVIPGFYIKTNMIMRANENMISKAQEKTLFNLATAEDVANSIVFLLSDRAKSITGRSIFVDSGYLGQL